MTTNRIPSNLDRKPPLVVVSYAHWRWLWRAIAIALPVACVVLVVVTLADYVRGGGV